MTTVTTGLFKNSLDAGRAVHLLEMRGVPHDDISVIAGESFDKDAFAVESHSKLPEGVAIGATSGAAVGALAAGLTSVAAISTGGLGLLAAGPLVAALTGAGAGAASGGVLGGLVGIAIPEHEVKHYEDAIEEGSVLVGVECDDDQKDAVKSVFEDCDATKISRA